MLILPSPGLGSVRWGQAAAAGEDENWRWDQSQWTEETISSKGEAVKQKRREQASSAGHHQQPVEELRISIVRVQTIVDKVSQSKFQSQCPLGEGPLWVKVPTKRMKFVSLSLAPMSKQVSQEEPQVMTSS